MPVLSQAQPRNTASVSEHAVEQKESGSTIHHTPAAVADWMTVPMEQKEGALHGSLLNAFVNAKLAGSTDESRCLSRLLLQRPSEIIVREKMSARQGMSLSEGETSHLFRNAACILFQALSCKERGVPAVDVPQSTKVLVVARYNLERLHQ